ncbi:MAG: hypothetical protein RIR18_1937 [Pseudomonadota bacterium]|jgi:hypothetical protein
MKEKESNERPTRLHYIPLVQAAPDMILGMPLVLTEHGVVRFNLPAGHKLNQANLDQIQTRHAEIICVVEPDVRTPEEQEAAWASAEKELNTIFQLADPQQVLIHNLRDAVMAYRRR